jgi:hypothetical protein
LRSFAHPAVNNFFSRSGSIQTGKYADMIVLDQNLFEIPTHTISATRVLRTIFGGKVVYDATSDPSTEEAIENQSDVDLDLSGESGYAGCEWHQAQQPMMK